MLSDGLKDVRGVRSLASLKNVSKKLYATPRKCFSSISSFKCWLQNIPIPCLIHDFAQFIHDNKLTPPPTLEYIDFHTLQQRPVSMKIALVTQGFVMPPLDCRRANAAEVR